MAWTRKAFVVICFCGCLITGSLNSIAQGSGASSQQSKSLEFEVASVKPHYGGVVNHDFDSYPRSNVSLSWGNQLPPPDGLLRAVNNQLIAYIVFAFDLSDGQELYLREHAPKWVKEERFDITARSSIVNPTRTKSGS